jgi:hypothetical protein
MWPEAVPERCWRAFTDLEALQRRHALPLEVLLRLSQLAAVAAPSGPTPATVTPGPNGQLTLASIPTFLALRTLRLKKLP